MRLADLLIRSDEDFVSARRKVHESNMVLSGDPQLAAVVTGEFSDLVRALAAAASRVLVHIALIR